MAIIYSATCKKNNKIYIGQTSRQLNERKREHELSAFNGHGFLFSKAIAKHGKDNFVWTILEECPQEEADELEKIYIDLFNTADRARGYNCTYGGDVGNLDWTTREMIKPKLKGKTPWMKGRYHSEEVRAKISQKVRAHIAAHGGPAKGMRHTEETKRLFSAMRTGRKKKGIPYTDEQKREMSERTKGKPRGPRTPVRYECISCHTQWETDASSAKLCPVCKKKIKSGWWTAVIYVRTVDPYFLLPAALLRGFRLPWGTKEAPMTILELAERNVLEERNVTCTTCQKYLSCRIVGRYPCIDWSKEARDGD